MFALPLSLKIISAGPTHADSENQVSAAALLRTAQADQYNHQCRYRESPDREPFS